MVNTINLATLLALVYFQDQFDILTSFSPNKKKGSTSIRSPKNPNGTNPLSPPGLHKMTMPRQAHRRPIDPVMGLRRPTPKTTPSLRNLPALPVVAPLPARSRATPNWLAVCRKRRMLVPVGMDRRFLKITRAVLLLST